MLHSMIIDLIISFIVYFLFRKIGFSGRVSSGVALNTFFILILNGTFYEWVGGLIALFVFRLIMLGATSDWH